MAADDLLTFEKLTCFFFQNIEDYEYTWFISNVRELYLFHTHWSMMFLISERKPGNPWILVGFILPNSTAPMLIRRKMMLIPNRTASHIFQHLDSAAQMVQYVGTICLATLWQNPLRYGLVSFQLMHIFNLVFFSKLQLLLCKNKDTWYWGLKKITVNSLI